MQSKIQRSPVHTAASGSSNLLHFVSNIFIAGLPMREVHTADILRQPLPKAL